MQWLGPSHHNISFSQHNPDPKGERQQCCQPALLNCPSTWDTHMLADASHVAFFLLLPPPSLPPAQQHPPSRGYFSEHCCESVTKSKAWNILNRQTLVQVGRGLDRLMIPHTVLIFLQQWSCKENTSAERNAAFSGLSILIFPFQCPHVLFSGK